MGSNAKRRKQNTSKEAWTQKDTVRPEGYAVGFSYESAPTKMSSKAQSGEKLLEQILTTTNLMTAMEEIEKKKHKAPGIDGMKPGELREHLIDEGNGMRIRQEILEGTYKPSAVQRVEIAKSGGGKRELGIPTVVDRWIQQAMLQILTPIFEPTFSDSSYGFRPGRSPQQAVQKATEYIQGGYRWVVDTDLSKFFDRVSHDKLMARVARTVKDKRVLKLIRLYLQSGVMIDGVIRDRREGTPQGGPLSPLLSNIMLTDLDRELEKRGHKFVRFADDCNIYVKSQRAGERVFSSMKRFLESVLSLKVNEEKSTVGRPTKLTFLGFGFYYNRGQVRTRLTPRAIDKLKGRVKETTGRNKGTSMNQTIKELKKVLQGWVMYYVMADCKGKLTELDGWIRRKLRAKYWKQWKRTYPRYKALRSLGVSTAEAWKLAKSKKGIWRASKTPQINQALSNAFLHEQGLVSLESIYTSKRASFRTA